MNSCLKILVLFMTLATILVTGCTEDENNNYNEDVPNIEMAIQGSFPKFTAKDLNGNSVTNEIFANKKLTVLNIWGTFCPPCIGEMPELGEWSRQMPDDVQLIGMVCDIRGDNDNQTIEAAKKILKDSDSDFVNIIPNAEIAKYLQNVEAVPTTIFINSQGDIIGNPIIGADVEGYKKFVKGYIHAKN